MTAPQQSQMVPLPAPMRMMTPAETRAVHDAVRTAARRHRVAGQAADEIAWDALAVVGIFGPAPATEPGTCTALYLPTDAAQFTADKLGVWQQCEDDQGHDGAHEGGEVTWPDGHPGTIPPQHVSNDNT